MQQATKPELAKQGGGRHDFVFCFPPPFWKVSPQEMVQEIHQVLMDREDTCHRTCFSLQLEGNVLDNFAELKTIEGLQEGSLLKVVEGNLGRRRTRCAELAAQPVNGALLWKTQGFLGPGEQQRERRQRSWPWGRAAGVVARGPGRSLC